MIKRHLFEGLLSGAVIGVAHAVILSTGGLYALYSPIDVAASFARFAAIAGFAGAAAGLLVGLFLALPTRFRRMSGWRLRPAPLAVLVLYAAPWTAFLTKQYLGRSAVVVAGFVCAALVVAFFAAVAIRLGRQRFSRPRSGFVPGVRLIAASLALCAGLYVMAAIVPPSDRIREGDLSGMALGDTIMQDAGSAFASAAAAFPAEHWNLLLLTIDTLRADHMGCYGYHRNTSPSLDALAESGIRFTRTFCQRPKTSPSFATILTGTYPARHGIHGAMEILRPGNITLAEYLAEAGWTTAAVITNGNLYPAFGFDQGFETYVYGHKDAKTGGDRAIEWLDENASAKEPWFLWVHFTDPHTPYDPPSPYDTLFAGGAPRGPSANQRQIALYDGEISFADEHMGRVIEWVERNGLRGRTLIVFTADHGESLGEHNYYYAHGLHPYEPTARIPLIISAPGVISGGAATAALAGGVDIVPTILDALGITVDETVQGRSLLPVILHAGTEEPNRFEFIEAGYDEHDIAGRTRALRRGATKYVERLTAWARRPAGIRTFVWTMNARLEGGLARDELYDLTADPGETVNLLTERRSFALGERQTLNAFTALLTRAGSIGAGDQPAELDEETHRSLKSLGYIK